MKLFIMAIAAAHLLYAAASATPVSQTDTPSGNSTDGNTTPPRNMCCNDGCTVCPIGWYCPDYECTNPLFTVCCNTERMEKAPTFVAI